jgi:hypothetical protein
MNILLDYLFPITSIEPTPEASTAFLKQVCVVVDPVVAAPAGTILEKTSMAAVTALSLSAGATAEIQQLFDAGLSRVFILPVDDLDLASALEGHEADFYTVLVSSDFTDAEVTASQAQATITISSYANLVSGTDDAIVINGVTLTAQAGAATLGANTFQAATSNDATAASLAAQINANTALAGSVVATVLSAVVTVKAASGGSSGNDITIVYTDNDTNVGAVLAGASGGHLNGGDGLFLGAFEGVVGLSSTDDDFLAVQAAISNRSAWHTLSANKAKNMFFAFGKMLSNPLNWRNQQYITMPLADDVETLGDCEALFDDKINFVISDDEFGERLGLFVAGGKAIVSPYIKRNLQVDMQSSALSYISGNQPGYTKVQAALLEDELQKVIDDYIDVDWISAGEVEVTLVEDNFVASGSINIAEPKALWRIFGEMRATL